MPVLPALKPMFDSMLSTAADSDVPVAKARAAMDAMVDKSFNALLAPQASMPVERDVNVPVTGGEITLRLYSEVEGGDTARPCHLYLHGGGFWLGTLAHGDSLCRSIARDVGCVVVSVGYRLAPEYKFPAAAEDAYAALLWLGENANDLGIDPARISVGGGSAGGNLAAVVSLMARDRKGPVPVLQILEIPVTDLTTDEPLHFPEENLIVQSGKSHYGALYVSPDDAANPYASPLLAEDLEGLPPALVMVAEYDPLQPEGERYAKRLEQAGVAVDYRFWKGQFHGSQGLAALIPEEAAAYHKHIVGALNRAYGLPT